MKKIMICRGAAVLVALAILSGCGTVRQSESLPVEKPTATAESVSSIDVISEEITTETSETEERQSVEPSAEEIASSSSEEAQVVSSEEARQTSQGSLEAVIVTEEETAEAEITVEETAQVTMTAQSSPPTTTYTQTAPVATTSAEEEKEPAEIVIPDIKTPLSPGTDTAATDCAIVDYSNSSEGYISVRWNETGKKVKLRIMYGDYIYDHDVAGGGELEYFPLSCGNGEYIIQLYEQTEGNSYIKALEQEITVSLSSDTITFLYPNKYVEFDKSSDCVLKAAELCAGTTDEIEKIAAIFMWETDNVTYDKQLAATVQSGYTPDPDTTLAKKTGICFDYASLFAAMTRSQGIPTRLVIGYAADNIYHAWNEVYTTETGWITPELLLSKRGYNITDATFYAGSSDKAKIAEYISDSGNYTALYYY